MNSFRSDKGAFSCRFDSKGTRLLCSQLGQPLISYDLATPQRPVTTGNTQFKAKGYGMDSIYSRSPCCFAGVDDELVVGASDDRNIYIWLAQNGEGQRTNNTPIQILRGHHDMIRSVRYNVHNGLFASCDDEGVVKLWSSDPF